MTAAQLRFLEIMRRHVWPDDQYLTDDEVVRKAFERYDHWRNQPLIDPNE